MRNVGGKKNNETVASPAWFLKWGLFPTIDGMAAALTKAYFCSTLLWACEENGPVCFCGAQSSWAEDSSWAGWSSVGGDHQDGPDRSVQRNNVETCSLHGVSGSAVTLATAALSSQFSPIDFLFPSFCPFLWLRSVQPGVKDEDQHRSAAAALPYYTISLNLKQSSLNFNIIHL